VWPPERYGVAIASDAQQRWMLRHLLEACEKIADILGAVHNRRNDDSSIWADGHPLRIEFDALTKRDAELR
jgi:hypothetical protein